MKFKYIDYVEIDNENVIDAIKQEFNPEEIFSKDELLSFIAENYSPSEVFTESQLQEWAEFNGYDIVAKY